MYQEIYPHKILIVEDDDATCTALVDNLRAAGFGHISIAVNGAEGLEKALKEEPDLILLDILLPVMDGMTMLKKLRESPKGKTIKVILLTNLNTDDSIMKGIIHDEPSYYLIKTEHSMGEVIDKVKSSLNLSL